MIQIEITTTEVGVTEQVTTLVEVAGAGPQGPQGATGPQGPSGPGLPAGGVEFDLIEKASGDDFDTRFTNTPTVKGLQLDTTDPADPETGRIIWNDGDQVPQFISNGVTVNLGLELLARCRNVTGSLIPRGTAVCIVGASAQRISIAPSDRTQPGSACRTLGLTLEDIPNNEFGKVSTAGLVRGLNTAAIDGDEGDELFVGATPGSLTTTPPDAPARRLTVGYLVTKNTENGRIFVSIRRGVRVEEIDDVQVASLADGDVVRYVAAANRWENAQLGTAADADTGDFDPAGSASGVQSNLDSHTGATTNVHGIANTADLIVEGDARLSDARTPLTHGNEAHAEDYVDAAGAAAAAPVQSVNTQTGAVTLDAGDVGADPAGSASSVQSNLTTHIDDATNPHQVTAAQVGLGNVDDTADLDKPISTATQSALDDKADKTTEVIAGTGLDGGGDLSESRTLNLDSATVSSLGKADTAIQSGDNVSLLTNDAQYIDAAGAPVQSVNAQTGVVVLDAADVGAAVVEFYTATVETTDWTGTGPYIATLTVAGLLATDRPIVDIDLSGVDFADVQDVLDDWVLVYRVEASDDDELKLYALGEPSEDFALNIKVSR